MARPCCTTPAADRQRDLGQCDENFDASTGNLRLDYVHNGLIQLQISGGGRPTLDLLIADNTTADSFWRQDTRAGTVLEQGPELVRTATVQGNTLKLTGDTSRRRTSRCGPRRRSRT